MKRLLILLSALLFAASVSAQPMLRLPSIIGDHMVLQENSDVRIWGWADANTTVTVTASWGSEATTKVDFDSTWEVKLKTPAASSESCTITVSTNRRMKRVVKDVLIGQVWLCSGQSNMAWSAANGITDMREELTGPMNPQIRLFQVEKRASRLFQDDCYGQWTVCTPESALWFSAVGYFFGNRLTSELNQPVGLVNSSWGGTPIEVWTPKGVMEKNEAMVASWKEHPKAKRKGWNIGWIYNAMIYPLTKFGFAGIIWYQGCSNIENGLLYGAEQEMLIKSWRKAFGSVLPFYFVQIAPHAHKNGEPTDGAIVREQQAKVADRVERTGMVVISDQVNDINDIHPRYKRQVGVRLANYALNEVYGINAGKYRSPSMKSVVFEQDKAVVAFNDAEGGLVCRGESVADLEICGESREFVPAQGMIDAENRLVVWNKKVKKPVAVRYCFNDSAIGNLFDSAGLPVAPFRSDSFEVIPSHMRTLSAPSAISVTAQCSEMEVRRMAKGTPFFTDRTYQLTDIPARFEGFDLLVHKTRDTGRCKVTASDNGRVYVLARRNSQTLYDLEGWTELPNSETIYATNDKSKPGKMRIFYKEVKAGQTLRLPYCEDFAGVTLLAKKIALK